MNTKPATISPTVISSQDEPDLQKRVRLFIASARPELAQLIVQADGGTVRVSGRVGSFYSRQLAISAARRVAGVQQVVDEIEVSYRPHKPK